MRWQWILFLENITTKSAIQRLHKIYITINLVLRNSDPGAPTQAIISRDVVLTTSARTSVRTFSPISGEMSLPNCCRVVRNRLSLLSCRAPQVAGNCWLVSADEVEEAGPLLYLCGGDGAPFRVGGEWLIPLLTERKSETQFKYNTLRPLLSAYSFGLCKPQVQRATRTPFLCWTRLIRDKLSRKSR